MGRFFAPQPFFRALLALGMIAIGILHFVLNEQFERVMPAYIPAHRGLVLISGLFEVAGGAGLLIPASRRYASFGLVALYVAVFPVNVDMALHPAADAAPWLRVALWLRLPLQGVLIAWALWVGRGSVHPA
ncbi:DoxX family protein [Fimbriimonas ginsengisoli]|uniref:DoxX family protein n=1 Tax=Fimbriimonas ginsengisoli Gsoil 348 TaxID=661478 RepID=A0A068NPS2_FIMGI|nr:hypothetical protein [Fimbriimonas ginsengisoli]AIE85382.1 hypothetical protein OP10G_2014 [Fimbriimonas ginsengisoli Gsoil 348]